MNFATRHFIKRRLRNFQCGHANSLGIVIQYLIVFLIAFARNATNCLTNYCRNRKNADSRFWSAIKWETGASQYVETVVLILQMKENRAHCTQK